MSNILAVVAHPDDEVIGCGATLSKLARQGNAVRVLLPIKRSDPRGIANWVALLGSFAESCAILGAEAYVAESCISEHELPTIMHRLHDIIVPHVEWADKIFSHWPSDVNRVHRSVSEAVEVATRPFRRRRDVYLFEVATSTDQSFSPNFSPNCYSLVDAADAASKCRAMEAYNSEMEAGRSPEALDRRMRVRGDEASTVLAEAFHVARHYI